MGRFFKTATPQSLDYMYQMPENLMMKVVQQASQDISENQAATYDLYNKLQLPALSVDKERARQILGSYEDKVNELTQNLQNDPLSFRRRSGDITGLARQIHKDFTSGEAAAIATRYNQDVEWQKRQQDLIKTGRLKDAESINNMRAYYLDKDRKAGGVKYNSVTGDYNQLQTEEFVNYVDLVPRFDSYMKDVKAHVQNWATADKDGEYIYEADGKREVLSKAELQNIAFQKFMSDNDVQSFIKQRSKIGSISGWYGNDGKLILPKIVKDQNGKAQYQWPDEYSALRNIMDATADTYDIDNGGTVHKSIKSDGNYGINKKALDGVGIDMSTGETTKDSLLIDRGSATAPITQLANRADSLRQSGTRLLNDVIVRASQIIQNLPPTANKSQMLQELKAAKSSADQGDPSGLYKFYNKYNIKDNDVRAALDKYKANVREANNIPSQIQIYKDLAKSVNPNANPAQIDKDANDMMRNETVHTNNIKVFETTGDYFPDTKDKIKFNGALQKVGNDFVLGNLPTKMIKAVTDPKTGVVTMTEVSNTELKGEKLYKDFVEREAKQMQITQFGTVETNEYGKEPKKVIVSKVLEPVPYKDQNGQQQAADSPYKVQLSDNVTIYMDKSNFPSSDIDEVVSKNKIKG